MKLEPLSHCPNRAEAPALRASFDTQPMRGKRPIEPVVRMRLPAPPAPRLLARMRMAIGRLFKRGETDDAARCDVDARLLELEIHKLNTQCHGRLCD